MSKPTEPTETPAALIATPAGYADWLAELKTRIHTVQQRATLAVNRELIARFERKIAATLARVWGEEINTGEASAAPQGMPAASNQLASRATAPASTSLAS